MMKRCLLVILLCFAAAGNLGSQNWYESSFYLLHEDHHTRGVDEVGRDADPAQTARLIRLSRPDVIQIHAKGNPGWTTYPSKIGHTPPKLARDVLDIWRNIARRDGYRFSAYYNIGRDGEIMKRRPRWNRAKPDGQLFERAICYHSGVAEGYLWPMIDEIMERYDPDGFWFDGSCFTVATCYCDKCRARFRREQNKEVPSTLKEEGWGAFKEMQRQIYREFVRDTIKRIKKRKPECLVAFNLVHSLRMPEAPEPGLDYLTGDFANEVGALSCEAHWCDGQNKPFDVMTRIHLHGGGTAKPKPVEQIRQEMAIIIANGGRYFAWDAPTQTSGLVEERHEFLGKVVAPFLRQRQQWCLNTTRLPDVSVLHTAANHYAREYKTRSCFPRARYLYAGTDLLCRLHLNYEMVSQDRLRKLDIRSSLLIVDQPSLLDATTIENLKRYVKQGGQVLMTGGALAFGNLAEVCGLERVTELGSRNEWTATVGPRSVKLQQALYRTRPEGAEVVFSARSGTSEAYPLLARHRFGNGRAWYLAVPLLAPAPDGDSLDELAAAVFGKVVSPENRHVTTDAPEHVEVVLRRNAGNRYVLHLVNRHDGKRTVAREEWGRPHYRITDIPAVPPCHVSLKLPSKPVSVVLQPQGSEVEDWSYKNGRLEADLPGFGIHRIVVVQLRDTEM